MYLDNVFERTASVSFAPPGTVNVRTGSPIEGPGGRWIPCASAISDGAYVSCVFEVGPGRRQVCVVNDPTKNINEALSRAIKLALTAAA